MRIEFDPTKRAATLRDRGIDMADADKVFDGSTITVPDLRFAYGEARFVTIGLLSGRMVVMAWTPRGAARRIISMRKANAKEQARYRERLR